MLRRSLLRAGGGGSIHDVYTHGVPKRAFPFREHPKPITMAPQAGGFYLTKHAFGWPFHLPFEIPFYRAPIIAFLLAVAYDMTYGVDLPFQKEHEKGKPNHWFFGNSGGTPHHHWQFQDGWHVPNMSGAKRYVD